MRNGRYILAYVILIVVQIILGNYFDLSRYVLISVLPVLILMLPRNMGSIVTMLIAFATGFVVDFFSTGMLGISSFALVPVALLRNGLLSIVLGDEQTSREEEISQARMGLPRLGVALMMCCTVYFILYVWVDSAGTVGFWSAALRCLLSVLASTLICVLVSGLLRPE